ncbi:hypothetical protein [Primorskyibacter sp. S187A]|uniref:hypothetical protein n=1 Tax=Primorskyibacter sp. S187A TaxID=3415130 RepID=UPI003C7A8385
MTHIFVLLGSDAVTHMASSTDVVISLGPLATRAMLFAIATAIFGLAGKIVFDIYQKVQRTRQERDAENRHTQQVLVDIILDASYDRISIAEFQREDTQINLAAQIDEGPSDFRVYFPPSQQDPTWADYRTVRRHLRVGLMVACDRYLEESTLYHRSYAHLASDDFAALSTARKKTAVAKIRAQSKKVLNEINKMLEAMERDERARPTLAKVRKDAGIQIDITK